ncbi:hypothetical protein QFC21_006957 [Naganishia friedmannii]|uniref:Uncharacterized protein n=1 Tax=Naganishia friedmannii TaxID=89922 RepID=A0ACC2UZM0_9TREE|nr:hypothetical protein QFC21_006957 [Naganishia friedmannii]
MSSSRSSTSSRSSSSLSSSPISRAHSPLPRIGTGTYFSYLGITSSLLGIASGAALFLAFPFPTTIPVFVALLTALTLWTCGTWLGIVWSVVGVRVKAKRWWWWSLPGRRSVEEEGYRVLPQDLAFEEKQQQQQHLQQRRSRTSWITLCLATCIVLFLLCLGITPPPPRPLQPLTPTAAAAAAPGVERMNSTATTTTVVDAAAADRERIFIAANLYNVVDIWETWQTQVLALVEHREMNESQAKRAKEQLVGRSDGGGSGSDGSAVSLFLVPSLRGKAV